jgi:succinate dehydrogenase / fumarate reductase flavoprotein subunit
MTRAATVVRKNTQLEEAIDAVSKLEERASRCSLSDTGAWTNQNVVYTKALRDMFPIAKAILKGAAPRRNAAAPNSRLRHARHPAEDPAERRQDEAGATNSKPRTCGLKSTIATRNLASGRTNHLRRRRHDLIPPREACRLGRAPKSSKKSGNRGRKHQ